MVSSKNSKEDLRRLSNENLHKLREGHNASPQVGVATNPDPALELAHEHEHAHDHHHGPAAHQKEKEHDVFYSTGTTEKGRDLLDTPPQDYEHHKLKDTTIGHEKSIDSESGNLGGIHDAEEVKHTRRAWRWYRKIRPFLPILVWAVFTA